MRVLFRELKAAEIEIVETVYGNTWMLSKSYPIFNKKSWRNADLIVINGEGTMHDDAKLAVYYLDKIVRESAGKKVILVNSLWQRMSPKYAKLLAKTDLITVREPSSFQQLGISNAIIMPDLSYYDIPTYGMLPQKELVKGTFYGKQFLDITLDDTVDITVENWNVIVNKLRHAHACFTGKHHEIIACCIARCPFVTPKLSTHKISGLGNFIDAELLAVDNDIDSATLQHILKQAARDEVGIYAKLFDKMESLRSELRLRDFINSIK